MTICIVVTGSRKIKDIESISKRLDSLYELKGQKLVGLFHGDADGVDRICGAWAISKGIRVTPFPVSDEDWKLHPNYAGHKRNDEMLQAAIKEYGASNVVGVAFWDGSSTGTADMIQRFRKGGIKHSITLLGQSKSRRLI